MPSRVNGEELQRYYASKRRRQMVQMGRAVGVIDVAKYPDTPDGNAYFVLSPPEKYPDTPEGNLALWNDIARAIADGVGNTADTIEDDPFCIFVTGICTDMHQGKGWYRQTLVHKTGHMIDQAEGEKVIAYLKAQENARKCEACGKTITTWECDNTRLKTFAARPENRNPVMAGQAKGI